MQIKSYVILCDRLLSLSIFSQFIHLVNQMFVSPSLANSYADALTPIVMVFGNAP